MSLIRYYGVNRPVDLLLLFLKDYDLTTYEHSLRVGELAEKTARGLHLSEEYVRRIKIGALLHDIGKLKVPKNILNKTDSLTDHEKQIITNHPLDGVSFLQFCADPIILNCVMYHHEKINGKGYPYGYEGKMIPLEAKIVAACDVFDALISDRPYQEAISYDETKFIMSDFVMKGSLDVKIVDVLLSTYEREHFIIPSPVQEQEEYILENDF